MVKCLAIERAEEGFPHIFFTLFVFIGPAIIEIIIAVGILWHLYGAIYALSLLSILILYMLFSALGLEWSTQSQQQSNEARMRASSRIVDSLLNYETVRAFGNSAHEVDICDAILKRRELFSARMHERMELIHMGQGVVMGLGLAWLTWLSGSAVMNGTLEVSDFVLINGYLLAFMWPLSYFGTLLRDMRKGITDLENIFEMIDSPIEVTDRPKAVVLRSGKPSIIFKDVQFGYQPQRRILKGISFEVPYGKTLAIVGPSGAGKSTISRLLYRFYDVTEGSVEVGGKDVREVTQSSLQSMMGIVPQETVLFNDTLYNNIAYGNPQATLDQVMKAVKLAHLEKFIKHLPQGLQTEVGERGLKLSGGEKQRVAIARVLLKKPKVYIFDEATSSLDTHTEKEIQKNLNDISEGATTVMIAHRLSTVVDADEIIVLEKGRIVEQGTHPTLLKKQGVYFKLWEKQKENDIDQVGVLKRENNP